MNIKKGKFLETILAEKRLEIAKMPEEQVGKVRQTYNFYDYYHISLEKPPNQTPWKKNDRTNYLSMFGFRCFNLLL